MAAPGDVDGEQWSLPPSSSSDLERMDGTTKLGMISGVVFLDWETDEEGLALEGCTDSRARDELGWGRTGTVARETLVFVVESMVKNRSEQIACGSGMGKQRVTLQMGFPTVARSAICECLEDVVGFLPHRVRHARLLNIVPFHFCLPVLLKYSTESDTPSRRRREPRR